MKIYILGTTELYFKSLGKQMSNTILFKKKKFQKYSYVRHELIKSPSWHPV